MIRIPKITLLTSVYQAEEFIDQLMIDVVRQTIFAQNCEWMIYNVNPAGDDYEETVILEYQKRYPDNIVYARLDSDPGIYDTWNLAIRNSDGEFITNLNCDDRRAPYAIEIQARTLLSNPEMDLVYNDSYIVHEPNVSWEQVSPDTKCYRFNSFSKAEMVHSNLPHNNPMWRRSLHERHGYFNQKYRSAADWDFWLRCAFAGCQFLKCPDVLGIYYLNPLGMSTNPDHNHWKQKHEKEIHDHYRIILEKEMMLEAA